MFKIKERVGEKQNIKFMNGADTYLRVGVCW